MNHYLYYDLSKIFIGSQNAGLLVTPIISKNRLGSRAFSYWAPLLWNQLSPWVREATIDPFQNMFQVGYRTTHRLMHPGMSEACLLTR